MTRFTLLHQGDQAEAICPQCRGWQPIEYRYRAVRLQKSKVDVPDVLVGVCCACDGVVTIPQQSAPKLKEARTPAPTRIDARIPKELRDLIGMIAGELGAVPEPFAGGVLRYYFAQLAVDRQLARRVARLANSAGAQGTPGGRIAFRLDAALLNAAVRSVSNVDARVDQSALVRGVLVVAKEDYFGKAKGSRKSDLRAIALAGAG